MPRSPSSPRWLAVAATLLAASLPAAASSAGAQLVRYTSNPRLEFTPFGGYQWGGSFSTNAFSNVPSGKLEEQDSFSWGAMISWLESRRAAVELVYLRQDTRVHFKPSTSSAHDVGGFANNYIQIGGRWHFPNPSPLNPFMTASLGVNVLDAKGNNLGSSWRFAWSLGGGVKYQKPGQAVGVRVDARWMVTPVPSGTYSTWCSAWGCYAGSGTTWLNQGQVSGGLVFAF